MKAELKRVHSPDVYDLKSYKPIGPFGVLVQLMIGPEGTPNEESFDTIVCSADWLVGKPADVVGDHKIVVDEYDFQKIFGDIQNFCRSQEGDNWEELAGKLSKVGRWEFADYKEYEIQR